jgi:DNA polymerase-3 subunit epsilon
MNFTVIDIETAKSERSSICHIGLIKVVDSVFTEEISYLIKPPDNEYSAWNSNIHGISADDTKDSLIFPEVWDKIKTYIEDQYLVAHNASYNIDCLSKAMKLYDINVPQFKSCCTYKLTGGRLEEVCNAFNIKLDNNRDALSDARACAKIFLKLLNKKETNICKEKKQKQALSNTNQVHEENISNKLIPELEDSNLRNPFNNKKVVFLGVLQKIKREKAAQLLKNLGANIGSGVTKKTDYAISGKSPGPSKMDKIEKYNNEGSEIELIYEEEFLKILDY